VSNKEDAQEPILSGKEGMRVLEQEIDILKLQVKKAQLVSTLQDFSQEDRKMPLKYSSDAPVT